MPLLEVLRVREAREILDRRIPSIIRSQLTYENEPLDGVLRTAPHLSELDRIETLEELSRIGYEWKVSGSTPSRSPSRRYEASDVPVASADVTYPDEVICWSQFEIELNGPSQGNPFVDVRLTAQFFGPEGAHFEALGFYCGAGVYRIRFLSGQPGRWRFELTSNSRSLDGISGEFAITPGDRRGPVRVADQFHFAYANGERYLPIGTTCYAWTHQPDVLQEQTLATLARSPFTKVRMCLFPKSYAFNRNEPEHLPFLRTAEGWDPERFDPEYWDRLEQRIQQLDELGIEADIILFHSYDRWGFGAMDPEMDDRYVEYAVARLSGFPNVWWALANEFDLMLTKSDADWERFASLILRWDPANHLRSIHNGARLYDHSRPWITHASLQRIDTYRTAEETTVWREAWGKPVVVDECAYEGDIDQGWGNITGEEMTRRFWEGAMRGGYVGHGETYMDSEEILWWSKGGELRGNSSDRIDFLASVIRAAPGGRLEPLWLDWDAVSAGIAEQQLLHYYGFNRPSFRQFVLDPELAWEVDVIDTWNMTIETLAEPRSGRFVVELPSRQWMAIRLRRVP